MAKTPKTTTTTETPATEAAANAPVDATADTAPQAAPAVTGGDFVPGVDGAPPTATPIVETPATPAEVVAPAAPTPAAPGDVALVEPAAPEAVDEPKPPVASGPPCASCGDGVYKDNGFATDGLFMAVTEKTEIETVHASNHVKRAIRNFHFSCAGRLIERAVDGGRAL